MEVKREAERIEINEMSERRAFIVLIDFYLIIIMYLNF